MKYLFIIPILIQLVTQVIDIVEDSNATGKEKHAAALDALSSIWTEIVLPNRPKWSKYPIEGILSMVGTLIPFLVSLKNRVKAFDKPETTSTTMTTT